MKPLTFTAIAALILGATLTALSPAASAGMPRRSLPLDFNSEQKIRMAERLIETFYVDSVDMDHIVEQGIISMLRELDPHSLYSDPEETKELTEPLQGAFSGVGISFNMLNDTLYVVSTIVGGPCEKVGVQAGDRIIWAGDSLMSGAGGSTSRVRSILRGPKGTEITLKVQRRGVPALIDFRVVRDDIPLYSVDAYYMAAPATGYIRLTRFAESTPDEVAAALKEMKKKGMKRLMIDLEGNGGGVMQSAIAMARMFLNKGDTIVYTSGLRSPLQVFRAEEPGQYRDLDVVVLVDQNSASASEILAGALQDNDRGLVLGRRTFGKGLVQRPFTLPDGSMIRLTTSRYYTPSGRSIQKPYGKDEDDYRADLRHRMESGELTDENSQVHGPDSLRHYTRNGRVVYGGGGISPDIYIPLDTTFFTPYYRDLLAKGLFNRFTLTYVDTHRADLKKQYPTQEDFIRHFTVTDELLDSLRSMAEADSITFSPQQQELSRGHITSIVKGLIGRDLYLPETYYRVANPLNGTYNRALELTGQPAELRRRLLPPR